VVDRHDAGPVFNIRFAQDMTGRRRWILMQLELGGRPDGLGPLHR
jgi:hypothetical protein